MNRREMLLNLRPLLDHPNSKSSCLSLSYRKKKDRKEQPSEKVSCFDLLSISSSCRKRRRQ